MSAHDLAAAPLALFAVLACIWALSRLAGHRASASRLSGLLGVGRSGAAADGSRRRDVKAVAVVQTVALDPRRRLHLVRCGTSEVLLLTGGAGDVVVGWLKEAST